MRKIVIFGTGDLALLACLSLREELGREVAAFTVERGFMTGARFCDADVVPFDLLASQFPAGSCELLIALGPGERNRLRERIFLAAQAMNYEFATYIPRSASAAIAWSSRASRCSPLPSSATMSSSARCPTSVTM